VLVFCSLAVHLRSSLQVDIQQKRRLLLVLYKMALYPPYIWPENKPFQAKFTGTCFCGHVQYEIAVDRPLDAKFCHCKTCQRLHGAPFQWLSLLMMLMSARRCLLERWFFDTVN